MTTKLEQAARQALEAFETLNGDERYKTYSAAAALREALAEQAEQEPVIGAYEVVNEKGDEWSLVYPVAVHKYKSIPEERITQTFYAAPVRTKDLTDVDLWNLWEKSDSNIEFARAVIAADRKLNGVENDLPN